MLGYAFLVLCKLMCKLYNVDDFNQQKSIFEAVREKIRVDTEKMKALYKIRNDEEERLVDAGDYISSRYFLGDAEIKSLRDSIDKNTNQLHDYASFGFMVLSQVINNKKQGNIYSNFVKQCIIVGLFDYCRINIRSDVVADLYARMEETEVDIAAGDTGLSCFEVHVPYENGFKKMIIFSFYMKHSAV